MRVSWPLLVMVAAAAFSWGIYVGYTGAWPWEMVQIAVRDITGDVDTRFDVDAVRVGEPDKALGSKMDVVMLGDSLVALARWNEIFPETRIANRGVSGDTVSGASARLDTVFAVRPKLVVVMVGINDVLVNNDRAAVIATYDQMIGKLKASMPVVVQAIPLCSARGCQRARISAFNAAVREIAMRRGATFIDINQKIAPAGTIESKFTTDGIHLSAAGYAAWRDEIAPFVTTANSPK